MNIHPTTTTSTTGHIYSKCASFRYDNLLERQPWQTSRACIIFIRWLVTKNGETIFWCRPSKIHFGHQYSHHSAQVPFWWRTEYLHNRRDRPSYRGECMHCDIGWGSALFLPLTNIRERRRPSMWATLLIQGKHLATNPQTCHLYFHHQSILMILDLNHHMYQAGFHPQHQVLCQELYHKLILVYFFHWWQAQVHLLIPKTSNLKQTSTIATLSMYHHMY